MKKVQATLLSIPQLNLQRYFLVNIIAMIVVLTSASSVLGATFAGYTFNVTGGPMSGTNVTVEVWQSFPTWKLNTTNSAIANSSGYWSLNINDSFLNAQGRFVKFIVRHYVGDRVDYIGGILPPFPWEEMNPSNPFSPLNITQLKFYLKEAATINITAINSSNDNILFNYAVVDVRLGFPIDEDWNNKYTQKLVYVPADRNYSIQIMPQQAMPVFYELNNLSDYPSPKKVDIVFDTNSSLIRVSGRMNLSNGTGSFDELHIITYLLEPGNMIFGSNAMPYNMSAWDWINGSPGSDYYNATTGNYNITLEGTTMSSKVLMFAIAKVGNEYWGGFRNISPSIGQNVNNFNFTLYKLLGQQSNITVQQAACKA